MAAPTRILGKGLTFTIDAVDYECDVTSVVLSNEEAADNDATTFCDAEGAGLRDWKLEIEAVTSTDAASLHSYIWDNSGTAGVAFLFAPHKNATATADQPHYTGTVEIPAKPSIGGAAGETWTYSLEVEVEAEPTKVIA